MRRSGSVWLLLVTGASSISMVILLARRLHEDSRGGSKGSRDLSPTLLPKDVSSACAGLNLTIGPLQRPINELPELARARGIVLLKIQKTASTSLQVALESQCVLHKVACEVHTHSDWNLVLPFRWTRQSILLTMLRDPVERVVSEYFFLKHVPADSQVQWDYPPELHQILRFLRASQKSQAPQLNFSLGDFLMLPNNPANNRQVRYLLGFARPDLFACAAEDGEVGCPEGWAHFTQGGGVPPGAVINSALQGHCGEGYKADVLLAKAKHRLASEIDIFGLVDCMEASMIYLSRALGFDAQEIVAITARRLGPRFSVMRRDTIAHHATVSGWTEFADKESGTSTYGSQLSSAEERLLNGQNILDVDLHRFAKSVLHLRMLHFDPGLPGCH